MVILIPAGNYTYEICTRFIGIKMAHHVCLAHHVGVLVSDTLCLSVVQNLGHLIKIQLHNRSSINKMVIFVMN